MIHSHRTSFSRRVAIVLVAASTAMSAIPAMAQHDRHGGGGYRQPAYHGGGYHGDGHGGGYHHGGGDSGGLIVGALLGAVAGAALTSAIQAPPAVAYTEPPPPPPPGVAYYPGSYAPGY